MVTNCFVGFYDEDMNYVDRLSRVLLRYTTSVMGFWFDSITSIPWSCLDLQSYLVSSSASILIWPATESKWSRCELKQRRVCIFAAVCWVCEFETDDK